jgi:hypothetical protein
MFLLVFATLITGLIGIYAEVMSLQAARMAANQNGIAQAMLTWHAAAVSMAVSIIKTNPAAYPGAPGTGPGAVGCSLTYTSPSASITTCPSPQFMSNQMGGVSVSGPSAPTGTVTDGSPSPILNLINVYNSGSNQYYTECVHLPSVCTNPPASYGCSACATAGFDVGHYQFYSVLYQNNGQDFVITFANATVSASNPAPGFVALALGNQIGLTASNLLQQLQHSGAPNYSYGTVIGSQLTTSGFQYTLPASFTTFIPSGSVATISSPDGF